jgi:hypothetical protein
LVLAAVRQAGTAIRYAADWLKSDKECVLAAVAEDGASLRYADPALLVDKDFVLAAIQANFRAFQYADPALRRTKEVALAALTQSGAVSDEEAALECQRKQVPGKTLTFDGTSGVRARTIPGRIIFFDGDRKTKNLQEVRNKRTEVARQHFLELFKFIEPSLLKERDVLMAALQYDGMLLQHAHADLRRDPDVVLAAMRQDGRAAYHADKSLTRDPGFMLLAMQECDVAMNMGSAHVLTYADADFSGFRDKNFLMAASRQDAEALNYADPSVGLTGNTAAKKLAKLEVIIATDLLRSLHRSEDPLVTHIVAAMGGNLGPTQGADEHSGGKFATRVLRFFRPRSEKPTGEQRPSA